jgi:hypothetical protein
MPTKRARSAPRNLRGIVAETSRNPSYICVERAGALRFVERTYSAKISTALGHTGGAGTFGKTFRMKKTYYLVGREEQGNAQPFNLAFTTESNAAYFMSMQHVSPGKIWPCEVDETLRHMAPFLHIIKDNSGGRPELVMTSNPNDKVTLDPFLDATRAGLSLWHAEYEKGQFNARIAFGSSAKCDPEHFPSMEERVKVDREGTLFHVLASSEEAAISMAAESRAGWGVRQLPGNL